MPTEFYPVYEGNAALGVAEGGGAKISNQDFESAQKSFDNSLAISSNTINERLKLLSDTHKTIELLDQEFNTKMFAQKVADRDNMYKSFMDGNASVKDYLPEDKTALKKYRDEYDNAYQEWSKNINNRDAAKKFKEAQDNLNDVAARLATRYTAYDNQQKEIQGTALSEDKNKMNDNLKSWMGKTDEDGKPALPSIYQKFSGYDANAFNGQAALKTVNLKSQDGLYDIPVSTFDYSGTRKKIEDNTKEGNTGSIANQYVHTYWDQYTPQQRELLIQQSEAATQAHNATHPNDVAEPIAYDKVTGKLLDSPQDFAAKMLLLQNPDKQGQPVGNEFALKVQAEKSKEAVAGGKLAIDAKKLGIDAEKANAYAKHLDALNNKLDKQAADVKTDISKQIGSYIDNLQPITTGKKSGFFGIGSKKGTQQDVVIVDDLPEEYKYVGGAVVNDKGKVTVGKVLPFEATVDGKTVSYYLPKYVDKATGQEYKIDDDFIKSKFDASKANGFHGDINDYLKALLKSDNSPLELVLKGQDSKGKPASANYSSIYTSAKMFNVEQTAKGEENIINPPADETESKDDSDNK